MSYPPQPGQPGPQGQPGPYGQQGPQGPPGAGQGQPPYPSQGQPGGAYPASGPMPAQGYPGGTQQFGQPGYFEGQQGYPGYPGGPGGMPPKNRTPLIVGLSIAGVLVVAGIVVLIIALSGGEDEQPAGPQPGPTSTSKQAPTTKQPTTRPRTTAPVPGGNSGNPAEVAQVKELATKLVDAISKGDAAGIMAIACDPTRIDPTKVRPEPGTALVGEPVRSGTKYLISVKVGNNPSPTSLPIETNPKLCASVEN